MQTLIDNDLKYGNLLLVDSPHLIARYNRALEAICNKTTTLKSFHVDGGGYSPEIAKEFDDKKYLNPYGVNKKIILLSLDQEGLPILDAYFSSTRIMISSFIRDNKEELFALTSRDVVYGELENSTFRIENFVDLLCIKRIIFNINTVSNSIKKGKVLSRLIDKFIYSDSDWHDENTINDIIELSSVVGDIRRHNIEPKHREYKQTTFFSRHFGGVYVFNHANDENTTEEFTVIAHDRTVKKQVRDCHLPINFIHIDDRKAVIKFLMDHNIIEVFSDSYFRKNIELIREKINFIVLAHMSRASPDDDLSPVDDNDIKNYIYEFYDDLPKIFHVLSKTVKLIDNGYSVDLSSIPEDVFFYFVRSSNHELKDLVNQLIAYYTPLDFLSVFMSNKALFYELYEEWPESKKSYIVEYLVRHYQQDKHRMKDIFFGDEPSVTDAAFSFRW